MRCLICGGNYCRQRRIKCDEHKPICNRCRKAQRKCLGTDYDPQSCALTSRRPGSPGLDVTADVRDILHLAPFLCSELIARKSQIGNTRQFSPFALSGGRDLVSYMHYLPQTCGGGGVLDIATSCVAQAVRKLCTEHFQLRLHPSEASEQDETRHLQALYAEALKRLQLALQDSECSLQVETLCATILLCTFEVCPPPICRWSSLRGIYLLANRHYLIFSHLEEKTNPLRFNMLKARLS